MYKIILSCLFLMILTNVNAQKIVPDTIYGKMIFIDSTAKAENCIISHFTNELLYYYDMNDEKQYTMKNEAIGHVHISREAVSYDIYFGYEHEVEVKNKSTGKIIGVYEPSQIYVYLPRMNLPKGYEYYTEGGVTLIRNVVKNITNNNSNKPKYFANSRYFLGFGLAFSGDNYWGWSVMPASKKMPFYFDVMYNKKRTIDANVDVRNNFYIFKLGTGFRFVKFASVVGNVSWYKGNSETRIGNDPKIVLKHSKIAYGGGLVINLAKKKAKYGFALGVLGEYNPVQERFYPCIKLYLTAIPRFK